MDLDGACAIVTGGASGIGRALVAELLDRGARVVATDIDPGALADLAAASPGDRLVAVPADVADPGAMDVVRDQALARFGQIDVVVLNAGVAPSAPLLDTSLDTWRWVLDVNLMGVVHGLRAFLPLLAEQGRGQVVVTASTAGLAPVAELAAYTASKHAVVGLVEAARLEMAGRGIGFTLVCPGGVRTDIFQSERNRPTTLAAATAAEEAGQARFAAKPEGARITPEEQAAEMADAIEQERDWLLPDQRTAAPVRERLDAIVASAP